MSKETPRFIYNFDIGPNVIPTDTFLKQVVEATPDDQLELNCQLFANSISRARGYDIPDDYLSSEHYEDRKNILEDVPQPLAKSGDIVGLSGHPRANPKRIHLAVVKHNDGGELQLIHAAKELQTVAETPLRAVQQWNYHETVRFIKRPKPTTIFTHEPNLTALRKLKFL